MALSQAASTTLYCSDMFCRKTGFTVCYICQFSASSGLLLQADLSFNTIILEWRQYMSMYVIGKCVCAETQGQVLHELLSNYAHLKVCSICLLSEQLSPFGPLASLSTGTGSPVFRRAVLRT